MTNDKRQTTNDKSGDQILAQSFLNDLDEKLWASADKLRQQLDAANYKHIVLGLIFLKYISDSFTHQQAKIQAELTDPENVLYLDRTFYDTEEEEYQETLSRTGKPRLLHRRQCVLGATASPLGRN